MSLKDILPKTIPIRGEKWTIKFSTKVICDDGNEVGGTCCTLTRTIEMEDTADLEVFLHEYFHAVWHEAGIDEEDIPIWIEHIFVVGLARDLIRNKQLFGELFLCL